MPFSENISMDRLLSPTEHIIFKRWHNHLYIANSQVMQLTLKNNHTEVNNTIFKFIHGTVAVSVNTVTYNIHSCILITVSFTTLHI